MVWRSVSCFGSSNRALLLWFALLLFVGFALYSPGLGIPRFEDDFAAYYDPVPENAFHFFRHPAQYTFYRPIPGTLFLFTQRYFGSETWPIQFTNILGHVLGGCVVFLGMLRIGQPANAARMASLSYVITQIGVFNVLGNDTTGQVWVVTLGSLALLLAYTRRHMASVVALAATFLCKETSIIFVPLLFLTVAMLGRKRSLSDFLALAAYGVLTMGYFWIRRETGSFDIVGAGGSYSWSIGLHSLRNLAQFAFALALPGSTVDAYVASKTNQLLFGVYVVSGLAVVALVTVGLFLNQSARRQTTGLVALGLGASLPFSLMHHVGESYVNTALPFFSVLVGIAGIRLLRTAWRSLRGRAVAAVILASILISHSHAIWTKTAMMRNNGNVATRLLEEVRPFAREMPPGGTLILKHVRTDDELIYATYLRPGFLLLGKNKMIGAILGRPDILVCVVDERTPAPQSLDYGTALVLEDRSDVAGGGRLLGPLTTQR